MRRPIAIGRGLVLSFCMVSALAGAARPVHGQQPSSAAPSTTSSAAPTGQPQVAAPRPPFPNRLNTVLPSWLRMRGEFRERMEGFDGLGFNASREDVYYLSRLRLNTTITPSKDLSFQAQVQDARVADKTVGPTTAPFRAPFDLRTGFADIGSAHSRTAFRVGRQELVYGDQRLVGHGNWTNAARTFDGGKVAVRTRPLQLDVFAASVVRILDGEFDKSGAGNRFAGAYATVASLVRNASVEPFTFWKHDENLVAETGGRGDLNLTTVGVRWVGRLARNVEYNTETALQAGSLASDKVRTWAGHYQLRAPAARLLGLRPVGEFNYASGDRNPADGTRGTFDQLYPTPHDKYGLADQVGWRNIRHVRAGVELMPVKGLPTTVNYHTWWLDQKRDALYNAAGAVLARVPGGATAGHVGQEIDVQVSRAITPQLQLAAGYAHIAPGAFLEEATPGASYSHPYVMATYVFLAER